MTLVTSLDTANLAFSKGRFAVSICSFLRPANTTAYTGGDIVSDAATGAALQFPSAGRSGAIVGATLGVADTDTLTPRLWIFDTEPTNIADNAAFALVAADMPKIVCYLDFVDADKILVGTLLNHYTASAALGDNSMSMGPIPYASTSGKLYGLLQVMAGYTPLSASRHTVRLHLDRA